jgi:mono/diheme cytochrome c family protein
MPDWIRILWRTARLFAAAAVLLFARFPALAAPTSADYAAVEKIFSARCLDCHAAKDPEGDLVLESFDTLMKGGELGPPVKPGNSAESLLVQMIEGRFEKGGKKKIMPPGKREKLSPGEIAAIKSWIDAGAPAPSGPVAVRELVVPHVEPRVTPRIPINAIAFSPADHLLAVARYAEVELRSASDLKTLRVCKVKYGNINSVAFHAGGALFSAGGQPGVAGEICQWNPADGSLVRSIPAHKDAVYSLALSSDAKRLASGSYDQKVKLWDAETGRELQTLSGHNGCVFGLAFRPDGKLLASASADRTVKLWDTATGERKDTLAQSLKEVLALVFSPDGKRLYAGGVDNRIRVWEISETAAETTNPILESKFAHEGAILNLAFSPDGKTLLSAADDRTVKLWSAPEMKQLCILERQPDWPAALAFLSDSSVAVGRLDGSITLYDLPAGKVRLAFEPQNDGRGQNSSLNAASSLQAGPKNK